jgi:methylmalonyl-CoA/ethylmalonyl-CoA epimerase
MTPLYGLRFHHFGLAVRDPARSRKFLDGLGYSLGSSLHDPLQKVNLTWCTHDQMPAVELVSPADEPGPVDRILQSQPENLYHICYETTDISSAATAIADQGCRILTISEAKPAILFGGRRVAFFQIRGFGLIELLEQA